MAKHQHRSFAYDENHRLYHHQKAKSATKPSLRFAKNPLKGDHRKARNSKNDGHHAKAKNQTYPYHHQSPLSYSFSPPDYYYIVNATKPPSIEQIAAERERIRTEFFSTYDVMTGVRIATTLGGFFGLMVLLVVYKSRGERLETMKALNDPKIAAAAAAVMQEEEDRELQEAMEATGLSIYPEDYVDPYQYQSRRRLMSLGNVSAPPMLHRNGRFSSIGGYSSLMGPQRRRFSHAGTYRKCHSIDASRLSSAYPIDERFYFMESDGDEADDEFDQITVSADVENRGQHSLLSLPQRGHDGRRWSNITCCSTESSYLERRCSALTLGLAPLPAISSRCPSAANMWDYGRQAPNIQFTQATPRMSPCFSERADHRHYQGFENGSTSNRRWIKGQRKRSIDQESFDSSSTYPDRNRRFCYDQIEEEELAETNVLAQQINKLGLENRCLDDSIIKYTLNNTFQTNLLSNRRAPLASISSLKMSSVDYQDSSLKSPISDSMFEASYADTDDDMDQFSTDSDVAAIIDMHNQIDKPLQSQKKRKFDTKTIACIERTAGDYDGITSIKLPHSQAQQPHHNDTFDSETICEISEIGPQALTFPLRHTAADVTDEPSSNTRMSAHVLYPSSAGGGSRDGDGGGVSIDTRIYRKSTGSMAVAPESAQNRDKNQFFSEPSGLNLHIVVGEPPKVTRKPSGRVLRMPSKTSYSSSSSQSSRSSYTTT